MRAETLHGLMVQRFGGHLSSSSSSGSDRAHTMTFEAMQDTAQTDFVLRSTQANTKTAGHLWVRVCAAFLSACSLSRA